MKVFLCLRTLISVETGAFTFKTKQYSTGHNSHICYGKRFCNKFFLNHITIALVHNWVGEPMFSLAGRSRDAALDAIWLKALDSKAELLPLLSNKLSSFSIEALAQIAQDSDMIRT